MSEMKAARLHAIGDFRVDTVPVPEISGKELLVKVGACGICGSDIPRIYQLGTSKQKYPLTLGHEFSGTVVAVGADADPALVGQRGAFFPLIPCRECDMCRIEQYVMCRDYDYLGSRRDGGFAEYVAIPSDWFFVPSSNPDTSLVALSMVEPACVAQHAIRRSGISAGQSIVIFGAGPIGLLTARWASIFGAAKIMLVDVDDSKVAFAREHGFEAINSRTTDVAKAFKAFNNGREADVAIEGTGFGSALENAIAAVRAMGTVVMLGNPHQNTTISLNAHSTILRKELNIAGTWNSGYANLPLNEWQYTVNMMDSGKLQVEDLVTHRCDLDGLPALCDGIRNRTESPCKSICVME